MIKKLVLYTPHRVQLKFHNDQARFRVAACGRQMGKSTMCAQELLKRAWENRATKYWFVSPTYSQAEVQYRRLVSSVLSACPEILVKKNQSDLRIKLINLSEIKFVSGESYNRLRGETLNGVIIDEVREQPDDLWTMIIRPMLSTTRGWAAFISTPNGFDFFYDLAQKAQVDKNWSFIQAPSTANPLFTEEEFEQAKNDMSEAQFAQEILAEFRDLSTGKAYINFTNENVLNESPFSYDRYKLVVPNLPIVVCMDFNLNPMSWVLGQQKNGIWFFFEEIFLENSNTQEAAQKLCARINYYKYTHQLKAAPEVILCGDPSGKAGQRAAAGLSDYDIVHNALYEKKITFQDVTPDSHISVRDRVNTVNAYLKDSHGNRKLFIHKNLIKLKKDFERVLWSKNNVNLDKSNNMLTHLTDAVGYGVTQLTPIKSLSNSVGKLQVIKW